MHRKRGVPIILVLLGLVVIAIAVFSAVRRSRAGSSDAAMGSGTIEATEIEVSAKIPGRIARILVSEGDHVRAGDLVAELDSRDLDAEVEKAEGALESVKALLSDLERGSRSEQIAAARARLRQANASYEGAQRQLALAQDNFEKSTDLKQKVDDGAARVEAAKAALAAARAQRDEAINGPREEEIRQADAQLRKAEAAVGGAESAHAAASELYRLQEQYTGPVVEAKTGRDTAAFAAEIARERESLIREGPTPEQIGQARANLAAADAALVNARQRYRRVDSLFRDKAATQQDLDDAEAAFKSAEAKRSAAADALADLERGAREQEMRSAELATLQATAAVEGAEQAVENAETALDQSRISARQRMNVAEAELRGAGAAREAARSAADLAHAGTREEKIAQAEAAVMQAGANLEGAQAALSNAQQAYADRILARQQLETARTQLDIAEAQRAAAAADLDLIESGHTKEAIDNVRGQVRQAEAILERARLNREEAEITAPADGTIAAVIADEGEVIAAGASVVTMMDLANMWLKVYLPVTVLQQISIGDAAVVTVDAAPGRTFPGEVIAIAQEAEFTPKNVQTVEQRVQQVFWVKVGVGDGGGVLKPGMPADARFG